MAPNSKVRQNRKVAPLVVVHLLSNGSGPTFTLCGKVATDEESKRNLEALVELHKQCLDNDGVLVAAMGEDTEVVIAAVNVEEGVEGAHDAMLPRFWGYTLIRGALGVGADLLDTGRLPVLLDLDETLVLAHTQGSLTNRINALTDDIPRLKSKLEGCEDTAERKSEEGRIQAAENEKECMEKDLECLKTFTENNFVQWDGQLHYALNESVHGENGKKFFRPVLRLGENCYFTRIDPDRSETSMLIRIRPGWEALRRYLAGEGAADKKQRFKVGVCTAAERAYALEAWRLLDPTMEIIPLAERDHRIICMGKQKKSLFRALHLGPWSKALLPKGVICEGQNIGPLVEGASEMPLAIVVDDRSDVWEPRNHSQLIKVRPYLHYRDSSWPHRLPTDNDVAEIQKVLSLLQNARSNLYYELQEVLTPYIHGAFAVGPWTNEMESMVLKTLDRAVSIVGFLSLTYTRPAPPVGFPSRPMPPGQEVSLCPQDPRELKSKSGNLPNPGSQSSFEKGNEVSDISAQQKSEQKPGQENCSSKQTSTLASKVLSSAGIESSYRCSMVPQDPRREWRAQLEKGNKVQATQAAPVDQQNGGIASSGPSGGTQKRKYDQVQDLSKSQHALNGQAAGNETGVMETGNNTETVPKGPGLVSYLDGHAKLVAPLSSSSQVGWKQGEGLGGHVAGLAGKMACVNMETSGNMTSGTIGQVPGLSQQNPQRGAPIQGVVQQGLSSCALSMPGGAQVGLAGIGQILAPQARTGGYQVYRQDGKPHHATIVQGGHQHQQSGDQPVTLRQQGIHQPLMAPVRVQSAPNALHPLTVQHVGGTHTQQNQHSVVMQNVMGQMGLPQQQVGISGTGQVNVPQVRVSDPGNLAKGSQGGLQQIVVINPREQQQVQVVPGQMQGPQQRHATAQPGFGWAKHGTVQTRPSAPAPQSSFFSTTRPGGTQQQYPVSQLPRHPNLQAPAPRPDPPVHGQQNPRPSGFANRGTCDPAPFLQSQRGQQGDMPRPAPFNFQASASGRGPEGGNVFLGATKYHSSDGGTFQPPSGGGEINPISQLNQLAQREKTELLFGAREEPNNIWHVTVSCKGEVMGMAKCRNKRLGKRLASLMALEKFGVIDKREYEQRSRLLKNEEDVVDDEKWTPCELLEGLYPGRVTYSDCGDTGPDRSRGMKAEVSVRAEDGTCIRCEINTWGMNKKKTRNSLANKMLKVRKGDSGMPDRDPSPGSRGFMPSGGGGGGGGGERVAKRMRLETKETNDRGDSGNGAGPGMPGYLEQLAAALDDGETEEGEIQE